MEQSKNTTGILLLNLGGPDSLSAVRPFLYNLFSDREIIKLGPSILQKPIAWLISTFRSSKSRNMYSLIGGKSPILDITKAQAEALEKALNQRSAVSGQRSETTHDGPLFKVYIGMRYWHPFMEDTVRQIIQDGIQSLIVLTLYPHYSKTTTGSSINDFKKNVEGRDHNIRYIDQWYDFPPYIEALAELAAEGISEFKGQEVVLLYSAHNLPVSFIDEGDPYLEHIKKTVSEVNRMLSEAPYNIKGLTWELAFQSKSGPVEWLEPGTEETITRLAQEGRKNILIVPISFVSDHIETLYEVDILFKELADSLGVNLKRCRSLNTGEKFIDALKELVMLHMKKDSGGQG